jgi:predicted phosphoribosyltransferase
MIGKIIDDPSLRDQSPVFRDRSHAGRLLAQKLRKHVSMDNTVLLAIPNGGVPVAFEISKEIGIPMDIVIVRKIQIPWDNEAGFGALTWDDEIFLNDALVNQLGLTKKQLNDSVAKTRSIIQDRLRLFKKNQPMPDLKDKTVILVDDGLASGFTMLATARAVKKRKPKKIIAAVPTASLGAVEFLASEVDEIICLNIRSGPVFAVADAYENWYDLTDKEIIEILKIRG